MRLTLRARGSPSCLRLQGEERNPILNCPFKGLVGGVLAPTDTKNWGGAAEFRAHRESLPPPRGLSLFLHPLGLCLGQP